MAISPLNEQLPILLPGEEPEQPPPPAGRERAWHEHKALRPVEDRGDGRVIEPAHQRNLQEAVDNVLLDEDIRADTSVEVSGDPR